MESSKALNLYHEVDWLLDEFCCFHKELYVRVVKYSVQKER